MTKVALKLASQLVEIQVYIGKYEGKVTLGVGGEVKRRGRNNDE